MDANVGYAHTLPAEQAEETILRIIKQVTSDLDYKAWSVGQQQFDSAEYVRQFRREVRRLMEPIYRDARRRSCTWKQWCYERIANVGGGAAGRWTTDMLGSKVASGSNKQWAMGKAELEELETLYAASEAHFSVGTKLDERGPTRPIVAIDTYRALRAAYAFSPIHNKYPFVGWDVGESPTEELARYIGLTGMCDRGSRFVADSEPAIAAYDFLKWDHMCSIASSA
jgi:hypothetical protein